MAKCDLCNSPCKASDLEELRPALQIEGVVDICPVCQKWGNRLKFDLMDEINVKLREAIAERHGAPAKAKWWQRWFK